MPIEVKTMEEAARLYRTVEASLESKEKEFRKSVEKEKHALEQLQVIMRAMLNQAGVGSMNIPGVAEVKITPKRTYGCADWDRLYPYIVENDCPELLQKKIHESNMDHWISEHPGQELPPGITVYTENILKVLKGK